eukprot:maker-scaffold_1-snap-gene-15.41-mRNA-1 protein AED:0.06 eAED:0.06 QI:98/1/1/1/0.8/0.66/6/120/483
MLSPDTLQKIKNFTFKTGSSMHLPHVPNKEPVEKILESAYVVEELLGQGTNARVYRAKPKLAIRGRKYKMSKYKTMKRKGDDKESVYAVKVMKTKEEIQAENKGRSSAVDEVKMFRHEISVMKKVKSWFPKHPNIVRLIEVCMSEDALNPPKRPCMVLEFLPGGELFDKIVERTFFSEQDAANLFHPLMDALASLHEKGVVHRDLKPENIVFGANDNVIKICDFGTAKLMDESEEDIFADFKVGSPGYFAPETIYKSYHPCNDVWSMGCILYTLLVGYMPFNMDDPMLIVKLLTCRYDFPAASWDKISPEAIELIKKMLSMPYADRISSAEVCEHKWFKDQMGSSSSKKNNANLVNTISNLKELNEDKEKKRMINRQYFFDNLLTARAKVTKVLQKSSTRLTYGFKRALSRSGSLGSQSFNNIKRTMSRRDPRNPKLQTKLKHVRVKNRQALLTDIRSQPNHTPAVPYPDGPTRFQEIKPEDQ